MNIIKYIFATKEERKYLWNYRWMRKGMKVHYTSVLSTIRSAIILEIDTYTVKVELEGGTQTIMSKDYFFKIPKKNKNGDNKRNGI